MNEWLSAQELCGLSGLPSSKRAVLTKANKECWKARPRAGKGGGQEFHISSLPKETQRAIRISAAKKYGFNSSKTNTAQKQSSLVEYMALNKSSRRFVDARLEVVNAIEEAGVGVDSFIQHYNSGELQLSSTVSEKYPTLNRATVFRWIKKLEQQGIAALANQHGTRKNKGAIDTNNDLQNFIIGMVVEHPHISNTVLYKAIKTEFKDVNKLPSLRTVERWVAKWKDENKQVFCAINSPDEWKNRYMAAFGSGNEHVTELNQLWEFDSTPADLMLEDGRHTIIGVIDVYTRRIKFVVSRTSNSKGVAQVIRGAILDWGIPQVAKTDNGSDYKSTYIKSVFDALDIQQEFCPPFQAWKKPHIERVFRTFSHDLLELLDGFIGHNVADRKQIESRKQFSDRLFKKDTIIDVSLTSEQLQVFCDNWIDNDYHVSVHSELKKTPLEMVREWEGPIHRIPDERALDILLSEPAGYRVVTKKGISVDGGTYIHPELGAIVGNEVHVYYDEHDMGRIYVYDMNDQFVCIAEDPMITGVSRKEVAAKTKEVQREAVQEEKRRLKSLAKKISKRDMAQEILAQQAQQNLEQNTVPFPRPSQTHTSERLEAAAEALIAKDGLKQSGLTQDQKAEVEAIQNEIKGQVIQPEFSRKPELPSDPAKKYNFWLELDKKTQAGLKIEEAYQQFYKTFPRSAEFEGGKVLANLRQQTASK